MNTTCRSGYPAGPVQPTTSLLRHRLADQVVGRQFAVAIAPAGFGKTTLLAQVARAHGEPVSWCRAEPGGRAEEQCRGLAQALLNREPTAAELAGPDALLGALRRDRLAGRRLVVVDDLHLLGRVPRDLVLTVGQLGAPFPRVLAGSRPADGIDVARFEAAGALVLDADEFRFRSWEVERLFREFHGVSLRRDAVLPLTWLTGGEAATLHQLARVHGDGPWPIRTSPAPGGRDGSRWPADQTARLLAVALRRVAARPPRSAAAAPPVTIRCLGGFSLTLADRDPDWTQLRPRQLSVLRLLTVHAGAPVHRSRLIGSFWPDLPPARAVHNLQVTVSRLRTVLEPDTRRGRAHLIIRRGESYQLTLAPGSTSDVVRFEQAVRAGRRARDHGRRDEAAAAFRTALEQYTGELLPEDGTAEWLVGERERLRQEAADAAASLARLELDQGRPLPAVDAATRGIEIDRYQDAAWRVLIAGHEAAGQAAAAARARRQYAELLAALGFDSEDDVRTPA